MKKILASALALIMSVSVLTACGDEDSSSKADKNDSSSVSSAADPAEESSKEYEPGDFTKAYTEKVNSNSFAMEMKVNAMGMDTTSKVKRNGDDFYISIDLFGEVIDIYKIGDKAIAIIPSQNAYTEVSSDELGAYEDSVNTFAIDDKSTFVGSTEEDGFTVETYKVPLDMELGEGVTLEEGTDTDSEVKYYYDADGNLKKIVTNSLGMESTSEITSFETENVTIELPDTSSMTKVEEGMGEGEELVDSEE